tara:strand:+ start:778 stop:903 length:126 start_codon:yes stop_codon:yes gene_type:complete
MQILFHKNPNIREIQDIIKDKTKKLSKAQKKVFIKIDNPVG